MYLVVGIIVPKIRLIGEKNQNIYESIFLIFSNNDYLYLSVYLF